MPDGCNTRHPLLIIIMDASLQSPSDPACAAPTSHTVSVVLWIIHQHVNHPILSPPPPLSHPLPRPHLPSLGQTDKRTNGQTDKRTNGQTDKIFSIANWLVCLRKACPMPSLSARMQLHGLETLLFMFAVWTPEVSRAYLRVFAPLIEREKRVMGKYEIDKLKATDAALKDLATAKLKNKINAQVQKIRRRARKS